jgi:hypothetical protein
VRFTAMTFPRLQLFELEDQPWLPSIVRDLATDYLFFIQATFSLERPIVPVLARALRRTGCRQIVDLCSGAGGPLLSIQRALLTEGLEMQVTLSDKFPNLGAFQRAQDSQMRIRFAPQSVDARSVPVGLRGFRTIFNSFHHFAQQDAKKILQDAVHHRQPIGIFEYPERSAPIVLLTALLTPLLVVFATFFMRPFGWKRFLFTYLVPLVPLTCWWDGIVSHFRAYTINELQALAEDVNISYEWHAEKIRLPYLPAHLTYLLGFPR